MNRRVAVWIIFAIFAATQACYPIIAVYGCTKGQNPCLGMSPGKWVFVAIIQIAYMLILTLGTVWGRLAPLSRMHARIGNVFLTGCTALVLALFYPGRTLNDHPGLVVAIWVAGLILLVVQTGLFYARPIVSNRDESQAVSARGPR